MKKKNCKDSKGKKAQRCFTNHKKNLRANYLKTKIVMVNAKTNHPVNSKTIENNLTKKRTNLFILKKE
jgi:hypothetical protein